MSKCDGSHPDCPVCYWITKTVTDAIDTLFGTAPIIHAWTDNVLADYFLADYTGAYTLDELVKASRTTGEAPNA